MNEIIATRGKLWSVGSFFTQDNELRTLVVDAPSATQGTVVVVHNPTTRTVALRLRFWSATGTLLFTQSQNVAARGVYALATNQVPALVGQSGAVTIANDAGYGELDGKAVALEPASGYSFDSPMVARPR